MNTVTRVCIVALLACLVVALIALKQRGSGAPSRNVEGGTALLSAGHSTGPTTGPGDATAPSPRRPRLVELGSVSCVQCQAMQQVIAELEKEYADVLEIQFLDVWKDPMAGSIYQVETIPTQVFLDEDGKEVFRHQGFYAKSAILAKWRELGYRFGHTRR